ncbi:hypothetical protein QJS10_CPA16g01339 [Acorus calamus]|uniref:Ricin B-like lectin R40G3 n=1 Tax=Acorus calamus TaxID=4465 RepID=A0AAV9D322_ACOCL|nr:hypothetical protein QJS10_CPA16g01339 [Acorus calamus]
MEFPFGHRHNRRDEDDEEQDRQRYPPPPQPHHHHETPSYAGYQRQDPPLDDYPNRPPPPPYGGGGFAEPYRGPTSYGSYEPTYPTVQHTSHEVNQAPSYGGYGHSYETTVQHISHEVNQAPSYGGYGQEGRHQTAEEGGFHHGQPPSHHHCNPFSGGFHRHEAAPGGGVSQRQTVRVYTKAESNFSLSIRDGKVVLARADPNDPSQHWIKDEKYSTKVKDEEGFPSFALVNKATGLALKHSIGATHPVRLIPYNPEYMDESVLWSESRDLGDSYRTIRMVNNIRLNFDAFHGDKNHGGVHDGTTLVLWEWLKGENQRWKIAPY